MSRLLLLFYTTAYAPEPADHAEKGYAVQPVDLASLL
jgi:hypothetical protein